jgi:hypothetical protein
MSAGDKYQIQEGQPMMLPHKCVGCHTNKNTKYIDLGMSLPKYGRFYLCIECFDEVAGAIGYTNPVSNKELNADVLFATNQMVKLEEENVKLRALVDSGIKQFRDDIYGLQIAKPELEGPVRRSPGRPKSTQPRATK